MADTNGGFAADVTWHIEDDDDDGSGEGLCVGVLLEDREDVGHYDINTCLE